MYAPLISFSGRLSYSIMKLLIFPQKQFTRVKQFATAELPNLGQTLRST